MKSSKFQRVTPLKILKLKVKNSNSSIKARSSSGSPVSSVGVVNSNWYWFTITQADALEVAEMVVDEITAAVLVLVTAAIVTPNAWAVSSLI